MLISIILSDYQMHGSAKLLDFIFYQARRLEFLTPYKHPASHFIIKQHLIPLRAMIQRTLLRQSRALGPAVRPATRSSLTRAQFQPTNQSLRVGTRPIASARWYGTETDAKKNGEGDASAAAEGKNGENGDAAKKQLEAKDKEIIDLKVCDHRVVCDRFCRRILMTF